MAALEEAVAIRQAALAPDNSRLADSLTLLGRAQRALGRLDRAEGPARRGGLRAAAADAGDRRRVRRSRKCWRTGPLQRALPLLAAEGDGAFDASVRALGEIGCPHPLFRDDRGS
ncbi:MAG: hypothetical protein R2991_01740 [Thermoanaerobaculia bacterium]